MCTIYNVKLYCDGACSCNQIGKGHGGYAASLYDDKGMIMTISGHRSGTTNNRMEMVAAISGMIKSHAVWGGHRVHLEVISDSRYLCDGFEKLKTRNPDWFKTVINGDLWRLIEQSSRPFLSARFTWIRGHDKDNLIHTKIDRLARQEAQKVRKQHENDMPGK